ncbi:MAG: helix-turn-helix domain-containing protein [Flexilinea sp.]
MMPEENTIYIQTEKELRIYMHPLRQNILRLMDQEGKPVTAKQIADRLSITHSSAKFHLLKLESIGLVRFHHFEMTHGIRATFYETMPGTVSLCRCGRNLDNEKKVLLQNKVESIFESVLVKVESMEQDFDKSEHFEADVVTGVAHLTPERADQLYKLIRDFMNQFEKSGEGTVPFEYALIAYKVQPK